MNVDDIFKVPPPKRKSDTHSQLPPPKYKKPSSYTVSDALNDSSSALNPPPHFVTSSLDTYNQQKKEDKELEEESRFYNDGLTEEERTILDLVDQAEQVELATLDSSTLKRMITRTEKAYLRNQELRSKFPEEPTRFLDSELDLDTEIRSCSILATMPSLYNEAEELGLPALLVQLLSHENSDIRLAVVEVLMEMTDEDVLRPEEEEDEEEEEKNEDNEDVKDGKRKKDKALLEDIYSFVNSLIEQDLLLALESAYIDEEEDENKWKYFSLLDNLLTSGLPLSRILVEKTKFLKLFLNDLKEAKYSANLGYKVELLAMLLQDSTLAKETLIQLGGMDIILRALSVYRKRDPIDSDQSEYMDNLFDILCASLSEPVALEAFLKEEGIELMLLMLKTPCRARIQAIRVLNYATLPSSSQGRTNSVYLVKIKGLIQLFPLFMRMDQKKLNKAYKSDYQVQRDEENIVCTLANVLQSLDKEQSPLLDQVIQRFCEENHEKLIQVVSMFAIYLQKASTIDTVDKDDEEVFLDQLEKGFFTLSHLALLIGILARKSQECKEYLHLFLTRLKLTKETVLNVLTTYAQHAEDEDQFLHSLIEHLDV